jgi:hypothetical protein
MKEEEVDFKKFKLLKKIFKLKKKKNIEELLQTFKKDDFEEIKLSE